MSDLKPKFQVGEILAVKGNRNSFCYEVIGSPFLISQVYYYPVKVFFYNENVKMFELDKLKDIQEDYLENFQERLDKEMDLLEKRRVTLLQMNDAVFVIQNPKKDGEVSE